MRQEHSFKTTNHIMNTNNDQIDKYALIYFFNTMYCNPTATLAPSALPPKFFKASRKPVLVKGGN